MRWLLRSRTVSVAIRNGSHHSFELRRSVMASCRAVLLPRFGGPEVLEVRENVNLPELKPNEVLVRTRAVSVNPLDTRMRSGYGRSLFEPLLPIILGRDISGEVAALGSSVQSLSVGQEVFGALHPTAVRGTYADYAILAEDQLEQPPVQIYVDDIIFGSTNPKLCEKFAKLMQDKFEMSTVKPKSISHVEASAIPFAALTAWRALRCTARIKQGQRLLVVGGGGAVGFSAIQLAVAVGCHVSTTCGGECIARILAAGAEQAVDYATEDYEASINGYFDAVLDTIGVTETERIGINLLKRGGHYMTLQGETASLTDRYGLAVGLPMSTAILLMKQVQYRYSHGIEYWWNYTRTDPEGLREIRRLSEAGKLKVPVDKTFSMKQVREAHEAKDKRLVPGKVVLEFD